MKKVWIAIIALAFLTPIGIILPALLGAGAAWGEWSSEEVGEMAGFVPAQMERLEGLWKAPIPDYSLPLFGESLGGLSLGYIVSALVGILMVVAFVYGVGKWLVARNDAS